jgi:hypothetical protein
MVQSWPSGDHRWIAEHNLSAQRGAAFGRSGILPAPKVIRRDFVLRAMTMRKIGSAQRLATQLLQAWLCWLVLASACSCLAEMAAYPRLEASFTISGLATDPFDYAATDVKVKIAGPDNTTNTLPAFFDGGSTWRVRYTPMAQGTFALTAVTLNGFPVSVGGLQPSSWNVTGQPFSPGFVRLDPSNPQRFITSNGRRFYPIGHNVAWWSSNAATNIPGAFAEMGAAGENWSRVWMDHFYESKNLEWPKAGNFGTFSLTVAQRWDAIVAGAERSGIAFQMTIQHHGQYSSTVDPNWAQNPYNTANGGFLSSAPQFFTDATAKELTKRKLRYLIARWGYSPAIMAWELFNEVQFTDAAQNGQWTNVIAWHDEMAQFLRAQDPWHHLVTTSSELNQPMWSQCDYYQHHDYPSDLITALRDAAGVPSGQTVKPVFGGECGMDATVFWGAHAPLWAGLMAGQSGAVQQWYWDRIEAEKSYSLFRPASAFVRAAGFGGQETLGRSSPAVTCPVNSALAFAPGGGFEAATQDTFSVGTSAPDGIGSAPRFLQGLYHAAWTPNGYRFLVNYSQAGTFSVQVLQIAASGAGLRIIRDGVTITNQNFPGTGSDVNTNVTIPISVAAGAHTIILTNSGLDWLVLGNITLNPYAPMLGAYQVGNTNFAALWLWHRTNIYRANPATSLTGTVAVAGLNAGTYAAKWWDTVSGATLSNFTFSVADANTPATLSVPAVSRSMALFAGPPPQAAINSPNLTQTVEPTNAPLVVSIAITNGGGLPLAYSLSVTGLSTVAYSSLNSIQAGGPFPTWRDISAVGTDITSSFSQLAAPKTAKDEGIAGPFSIGFGFPFFSGSQAPGSYTNLYVSPNGFIAFTPFSGDTSTNPAFPAATNNAPSNCIAWCWDDLDLATAGRVYLLSDPLAAECTVQFQSVVVKGTSATVSGQIILRATGEILLIYQALGKTNTCTVGVQNATRDAGHTAAYNNSYLQNYFAVNLTPAPWLQLSTAAGYVPRASSQTINVTLVPAAVPPGTYNATLLINTGDPVNLVTALPVSLNLLAAPSALTAVTTNWNAIALSWQDNAVNETGFEIERRPGTNGTYSLLASLPAGTTRFTDTNVSSRATYQYRVRAVNAGGTSGYSGELLLTTPPSPIELWRLAFFGTMENTGSAADSADPDHDNLVNLVEYAFALDPNTPSQSPLTCAFTGGHLVVTYKRPRPVSADVQYLVEVTSDLRSGVWNSGPAYTSQAVTDNGDGTETVTVTALAGDPSTPVYFLRILLVH